MIGALGIAHVVRCVGWVVVLRRREMEPLLVLRDWIAVLLLGQPSAVAAREDGLRLRCRVIRRAFRSLGLWFDDVGLSFMFTSLLLGFLT